MYITTLEIQNFSPQQKIAVVNSSLSVSRRQFSVSRRRNSLCLVSGLERFQNSFRHINESYTR